MKEVDEVLRLQPNEKRETSVSSFALCISPSSLMDIPTAGAGGTGEPFQELFSRLVSMIHFRQPQRNPSTPRIKIYMKGTSV